MLTLNLFTNLPVDTVVAADILKDASKAVSKIIGQPASYVMILLNGGTPTVFAGTEQPAAYGELISIGGLGPTVNGKLSSTIAEILQTKLHIDSSRFYIKFYDAQDQQQNVVNNENRGVPRLFQGVGGTTYFALYKLIECGCVSEKNYVAPLLVRVFHIYNHNELRFSDELFALDGTEDCEFFSGFISFVIPSISEILNTPVFR